MKASFAMLHDGFIIAFAGKAGNENLKMTVHSV
jgi:hypothetical protein